MHCPRLKADKMGLGPIISRRVPRDSLGPSTPALSSLSPSRILARTAREQWRGTPAKSGTRRTHAHARTRAAASVCGGRVQAGPRDTLSARARRPSPPSPLHVFPRARQESSGEGHPQSSTHAGHTRTPARAYVRPRCAEESASRTSRHRPFPPKGASIHGPTALHTVPTGREGGEATQAPACLQPIR